MSDIVETKPATLSEEELKRHEGAQALRAFLKKEGQYPYPQLEKQPGFTVD